MATGSVWFFQDLKGHGYIETDESVSISSPKWRTSGGPDLDEGQDVEFVIESSPKGPRGGTCSDSNPASSSRFIEPPSSCFTG